MKYSIALAMCVVFAFPVLAADTPGEGTPASALVIIDIQDFYFPGGKVPLVDPEAAADNAAKILASFRAAGKPVVHVRHDVEDGGAIHKSVAPINGEMVFTKSEVSCFNGTEVLAYLRELGVEQVVLVGMQTHMCLEAATRAAYDLGFQCVVDRRRLRHPGSHVWRHHRQSRRRPRLHPGNPRPHLRQGRRHQDLPRRAIGFNAEMAGGTPAPCGFARTLRRHRQIVLLVTAKSMGRSRMGQPSRLPFVRACRPAASMARGTRAPQGLSGTVVGSRPGCHLGEPHERVPALLWGSRPGCLHPL